VPSLLSGAWGGPWVMLLAGMGWVFVKIFLMLYLYLWIRATFPRYRYDQLMNLGWRFMIPASLVWIVLTGAGILAFQAIRS